MTAVEDKIPDVSSLVKKTDSNTNISEIENKVNDHNHDKYITTPEFNTLAARVFKARLAQANLITKTDFDIELKKISDRVTSNKSKHLLVETEFEKLEKFDAAYFRDKSYFDGDGTQNYLVFQPVYKYFEKMKSSNLGYIISWKSKGLSNKKMNYDNTFSNLAPKLEYDNARIKLNFHGSFLRMDKVALNYGSIVNIYIVYKLTSRTADSSITLQSCLFGAVKVTKNLDTDKYKYSGSSVGFDSRGTFSHPSGGDGKNVIFGADLSGSDLSILVLGKDFIQGTDGTTIYAEKNVFN